MKSRTSLGRGPVQGGRQLEAESKRKEMPMSVIPQEGLDILSSKSFAHLATIGPNGEPQSSPVWFDWDGTYVRISQTKTRQKYRTVQRHPHVALSILDPNNPYHCLEIRGKVVRIEDDPKHQFIDFLAKKYLGVDTCPYSQPGEERVILAIQPEDTTSM
jgi:PPOX class probable F420-dependent enzyme